MVAAVESLIPPGYVTGGVRAELWGDCRCQKIWGQTEEERQGKGKRDMRRGSSERCEMSTSHLKTRGKIKKNRLPGKDLPRDGLSFNKMVEAGGVEPPSGNIPFRHLHT